MVPAAILGQSIRILLLHLPQEIVVPMSLVLTWNSVPQDEQVMTQSAASGSS
jgi:hypothetical protein